MRKISLVLAILFVVGIAYVGPAMSADVFPPYSGVIIDKQTGDKCTAPMVIRRVRYAMVSPNDPGLSSGDVVVWDTNSVDAFSVGVTISGYVATTGPQSGIAGVLVTAALTQDGVRTGSDTVSDNWAYMAVSGYCLAKSDVSETYNGCQLAPSSAVDCAFGANGVSKMSGDAGTMLKEAAADGVSPVMLHIR